MINGKKVVAVTLARGGSKGIPRKNMVDINGKPLIDYTIDEVLKSKYIDSYFVSSDDKDILAHCSNRGVQCIIRPKELANDTAKSSDALIHAVRFMNFHYVVEVMATNPLKTVEDIDGCIERLVDDSCQSVVSVVRIYDHHPSRVKHLDKWGRMQDFYPEVLESRRQDLTPEAYVRNGSIYAMEKVFLMNEGARYNKASHAYIMPPERTINIDEPEDLEIAKLRLSK